jgi:hypothetical protein
LKVLRRACPKCGRQIEGLTDGQLAYNWEQHWESHLRKEKK